MNCGSTKRLRSLLLGSGALFFALAATGLCCIQTGTCQVPFPMVIKTILSHLVHWPDPASIPALNHTIIWDIRLPRTLLAMAVGVSLSVSGVVFQGCFRNPLVEPYVLGASSGAAFGAALGIVFPAFFLSVQIMAFVFSALAVAMAYTMARTGPDTPVVTLVLSGIITGSVFAALVGLLKYLAQDTALREIVFWLMGGFYYAGWQEVRILFAVTAVGLGIIWTSGWQLNVLSMGEEEAKSLGINPGRTQFILISLATLMTAAAVSATGIIAWVGLMIPHAARLITGPDHRRVVPVSAVLGAIYLIICDTLARTLTTAEIPIGIITSLVGAPYLFYLVRTRGGQMFGK
ncbi:iron ABC transporter permease [uncultured Desulfobacter sp.]|uniref:FecCD family ABC transporter permease n=1 Tax=uncultured Desulfobacter sp. TaxID=240139 RepID=UPI0029F47A8F|nr:iron ABC transporter permease [uncultured Desulfobacter sp.]